MVFKNRLALLFFLLFLSVTTLALANHHEQDPQKQYQQCQRRCQQQEQQQEKQQCQQRCEQQLREQEERQGEQGGHARDPQQEYQQCQRRCQQEGQQQKQCQQQCEQKRREQEESRRGQGQSTRDPQREFQDCQRRCQQQEKQKQQQKCQKRCEKQRREQEGSQREQGESTRDAQREFQQCQHRCQQEKHPQRQHECQQRCEQQRREQEERQQGQGSTRDPQQEFQQCQRRCQQEEQQQEQQQCQQRCEQQRREQEERQQGQGSTRDPQQEFQQCQRRCQQEEQQQEQQQCQQRCEQQRREQEERQQGQGSTRDPQQEFQQCQRRCQQEEQQQEQQQCQQRCEQQRREQEERQRGQGGNEWDTEWEGRSQSQEQQGQKNNPYFLDEESFEERFRTQHGYTRVSQRFSQISNLFRGIENYRLGIFEANPSTFMIPHHLDADAIFFVVRGRGTINLVHQQNKESYNLERGNVIRVPAGALMYLINRDNNDKFQIASLFQPVSTPTDSFREFFGVGGENPQSFFNTFSDEILEAAFHTEREQLDRLFRQQKSGEIIQASQEQIRALTRDASSSRERSPRWPIRGSQSRGPFDLLNQRPTDSNEYGELYRVDANEYCQLQDLDTEVAFYNIKKGAMLAPFYNSRATSLVVVVNGRGRFEMACPHLPSRQGQAQGQGRPGRESEQEERRSTHYQRVSARLSPRTAFIIPAGHPVSIVASDNENLQIVAFKVNAANNQRNYLAGQNNVLNQLERAAKELTFNMPAREVEAIFNNQRNSVFLPGPNQRQQREEGRHDGFLIETIADIMAF